MHNNDTQQTIDYSISKDIEQRINEIYNSTFKVYREIQQTQDILIKNITFLSKNLPIQCKKLSNYRGTLCSIDKEVYTDHTQHYNLHQINLRKCLLDAAKTIVNINNNQLKQEFALKIFNAIKGNNFNILCSIVISLSSENNSHVNENIMPILSALSECDNDEQKEKYIKTIKSILVTCIKYNGEWPRCDQLKILFFLLQHYGDELTVGIRDKKIKLHLDVLQSLNDILRNMITKLTIGDISRQNNVLQQNITILKNIEKAIDAAISDNIFDIPNKFEDYNKIINDDSAFEDYINLNNVNNDLDPQKKELLKKRHSQYDNSFDQKNFFKAQNVNLLQGESYNKIMHYNKELKPSLGNFFTDQIVHKQITNNQQKQNGHLLNTPNLMSYNKQQDDKNMQIESQTEQYNAFKKKFKSGLNSNPKFNQDDSNPKFDKDDSNPKFDKDDANQQSHNPSFRKKLNQGGSNQWSQI